MCPLQVGEGNEETTPIANLRIEPAGEVYKLKKDSGRYVAIADWAKSGDEGKTNPRLQMLHDVADSASPSMLWKIEPISDGFWTITNCASNKCLFSPKPNPYQVLRQSTFREGDLQEQWKIETVSP